MSRRQRPDIQAWNQSNAFGIDYSLENPSVCLYSYLQLYLLIKFVDKNKVNGNLSGCHHPNIPEDICDQLVNPIVGVWCQVPVNGNSKGLKIFINFYEYFLWVEFCEIPSQRAKLMLATKNGQICHCWYRVLVQSVTNPRTKRSAIKTVKTQKCFHNFWGALLGSNIPEYFKRPVLQKRNIFTFFSI